VRPPEIPMKLKLLSLSLCVVILGAVSVCAQVPLSTDPARVVGHPQVPLSTLNPNLVEGRELYAPQGIAVDRSVSPPVLYVSDTGNNRILVWKNASQFNNGAPADLIIGQNDRFSTFPQGPGIGLSTGLNSPTGLALLNGALYVADSGNNRVLRFPNPLGQTNFPDLVIGQTSFGSRATNGGGAVGANTLFLASGNTIYRAGLAFDSLGNLYVTDAGNHRVLRFPASVLTPNNNGPAADLVIGQVDFATVATALQPTAANRTVKDRFAVPSGIGIDPSGRLFVSDSDANRPDLFSRVLVFLPPFTNAMSAARIMGVVVQQPGQPVPQAVIDGTVMIDPEGIFFIGSNPGIVDSRSSRILLFDDFGRWPSESVTFSPQAIAVVGQLGNFNSRTPNRGQPQPSENTLSVPNAAAMGNNELFIVDSGNNRVVVIPQSGSVVGPNMFGAATRILGQDQFAFNSPNLIEGREFQFLTDAGLVVDWTSNPPRLYVADTFNNRILGFSDVRKVKPGDRADIVIGQPDMNRALCNYPNNDANRPTQSSLCRPTGLAIDSGGNLWVADSGNGRVLRFPSPFQNPTALPQADLVLGQNSFTSKISDPTAQTMANPYGLAFAGDNGVLVSDSVHNRVLFFPKTSGAYTNGMAATKVYGQPDFTSSGAASTVSPEDNRMNSPHHIATDSDGRLYVADTGANRILIFDRLANLPGDTNPRAAVSLSSLRAPRGVWVNSQTGEIWVAEAGGGRSLRYPRFDQLPIVNYQSDFQIPDRTNTLALGQDPYGDLLVADAANRVAIYFPGLAAVNGASFLTNRPLAPGVIASLFPRANQFGSAESAATSLPLPTDMGDVQVLVNGTPAPLFYVSPKQINLLVPTSAPASGTAIIEVIQKSSGQVLATSTVPMNIASPSLFTSNASGSGQVAALNQDGVTVNDPSHGAARGSVISLFATGQGVIPGAPPDGTAPSGLVQTPEKPRVIIGNGFVPDENVQFSGLAPGFVGLWQINVKIPETTAPGNNITCVVQYKSINSNGDTQQRVSTTITVN